ncbi:MAG: outer membrane beta-barrel protein [Bacteriovoracaceae bacterium]|nr:outer membrane beta-barrel protein [Bacteriovoracaceae bacterium]
MSLLLRVCLFFLLIQSQLSWGQSGNFLFQPFFGYERVYHSQPSPYWQTRNNYGVRVLVGPQLLSLDGEYAMAKDDNLIGATTVEHSSQKIKVGLRSTFNVSSYLGGFLRAGVQWKTEKRTETTAGVPTESTENSTDPYAGAGVVIAYAKNLALTADVTAVFIDSHPNGRDVEYQYSAGLVVKFGQ